MKLSPKDIDWWRNHTNQEILEKYGISIANVSRTKKKYSIKNIRKSGSGSNQTTGSYAKCKNSSCKEDVWVTPSRPEKYCSRDCTYTCVEYRDKLSSVDKSYMQTEAYSVAVQKEGVAEYRRYANKVHRLSDKVYNENIDTINPDRHPRTLSGVEGGWQLDHIIEVRFGFDNHIPYVVLCDISNLRMLPWKENLARNKKDQTLIV